jgi:hypothetical protein
MSICSSSGARFLAGALGLLAASAAPAMAQSPLPDFAANDVGWVSAGDLVAAPGSPPIVS